MKRIKFGLLALASIVGISAAATSAKSTAKRTLPNKYYAQQQGSSFIWVQTQPPAPAFSCLTQSGASCTITTTVAPQTIANYNGTYLTGRLKNPASPANTLYK